MTGTKFVVLFALFVAVGALLAGAGVSAGDGSGDTFVNSTDPLTTTPTNQTAANPTDESLVTTTESTNDTLDSTTDTTDDSLKTSTESTDDTLDTTTESTGDAVDDTTNGTLDTTTESTNDSLDTTTESTDDTLNTTTDSTDDALETSTESTNDAVDTTTDTLDETIETVRGSTNDTPWRTVELTNGTVDAPETTAGDTLVAVDSTVDETLVDEATGGTPTSGAVGIEARVASGASPVDGAATSSSVSTTDESPVSPRLERDHVVVERSSVGAENASDVTSGVGRSRNLAETPETFAGWSFRGSYGPRLEPAVTLTLSTLAAGLAFSKVSGAVPILSSWRPLARHAAGSVRRSIWGNRSFRVGPLPGYSRYDESDPLENEIRSEIYDIVSDTPGIHRARVAHRASISPSTVRYHTRVLERERLVETEKVGGKQRLYPLGFEDVELAAALESDSSAAVVGAVIEDGPLSVSEIAQALGRSPGTVSYHLDRLEAADVLEREELGNTVLVHAPPSVRAAVTTKYGIETA